MNAIQKDKKHLHLYRGMYYRCMNHFENPNEFFDVSKYPFIPSGCYFCDSLYCNVTPDIFISSLRVIDNKWRQIHYDSGCKLYYHLFHCRHTAYKFECHTMNNNPYYICPFCMENKKYNILEETIFDAVSNTTGEIGLATDRNPLCIHQHSETDKKTNCSYCRLEDVNYSVYQKAIFNYYHKQMMLKLGYREPHASVAEG